VLRHFARLDLDHVTLPQGQNVEAAIAALAANPDVEFAQPNYIRHIAQSSPPNDPLWLNGTLWGLLKIQAQNAWSTYTPGDSSVVVAGIDTGINYNHPDLIANIWTNPLEIAGNGLDDDGDGYVDDVHGINAITHSGDPMDDHGHGTHTAGTMAAVGNNATGVVGVNWNAKIIGCKFLNSAGNGSDTGAIECFNYLVMLKQRGVNIRVTNNSWGGTRSGGIDQALKTAIDAAGSAGILNAFAAGNNNANNDVTPFDPASIPSSSIIAVAASDPSDNRASFSNYGNNSVHLAAPGVSITSTFGGGYAALDGTSMATPHVAGAASIIAFLNPALSPSAIKTVLMNNVDALPQWTSKVVSGGRLNLFKVATAVVTTTPPTVALTGPSGGSSFTPPAVITLTANASKPGGSVSSVKFYANGTLVGTDSVSPYSVSWSGMASGAYTLTAVATDNLSLTATSAPVAIVVDAMPTVALTNPANGVGIASTTVTLAATASDSDGTIASVKFYANGVLINTDTTAPYSFDWTNVAPGSYGLTAVATDNLGGTATSGAANVTVTGVLPSPWSGQDIGAVGVAGNATAAGGTFTVAGGGADIWGTADAFQFVSQPWTGDGQIVARVATQQNTNGWALAGVMIRDSLAPGARHATLLVTPSNGLAFERRLTTNGSSVYTAAVGTVPQWVKLVRSGTLISAFQSLDGVTWTSVGSDTVTQGTTVYVGLAVCSHVAGVLGTATFDNVSVTAPGSNPPPTVTLTSPTPGASQVAPGAFTLTATAGDDGSIASVQFYANGNPLNTDTVAPYSYDWTNVAVGNYLLTAVATDNLGATTTSGAVNVTVTNGGSGLPSPWSGQDIGAVGVTGNATAAGGTFTVAGGGADIWGTADAFQFVSQPWTGDGQIVARVASQQNTNGWALAGVMIRDSLAPGARHATLLVTPSNGLAFERRLTTGGMSVYTAATGTVPQWVKLVRSGTLISAFQSLDGMTWTSVGSDTVTQGTTVYVGLAVCSHVAGVLGTATFDNVSVTAPGSNPPPTVTLTSPTPGASQVAPGAFTLTATAGDDGSIASVQFYADGNLLNTDTVAPYSFDWTNVAAGNYLLTAVATDNLGATTTSGAVNVTVTSGGSGLPSPWGGQDIGAVGVTGNATAAGGTFTVAGGGADIWGTADAFQFVSQPWTGDGQIVARVATQQNTNGWALAGVMIRESLAAGARHATLLVTPSNGLAFERRLTTNGSSVYTAASGTVPQWVKLVRAGSLVSAYQSLDGATWTPVGSDTVTQGATVYVGLAVCSHVAGVLGTATFDNVSVTAPGSNPPPTVTLTSPTQGASQVAPGAFTLTATAGDDGSIASVKFYADGNLLNTDTVAPYSFAWTSVAVGNYLLTAVATDNLGATTTSGAVNVAVTSGSGGGLPSPWTGQDIGAVGVAGNATAAGGTFTVAGGGADIWGTADAFQFVSQPWTGDGQIVARVATQQNTNGWALAGVMLRESLSPGARHATLLVTPSNGLAFERRLTTNGSSVYTAASGTVPQWVKLVRAGAVITAYQSVDGVTWTSVGSDTLTFGATVFVGLAVCSHVTGVLGTATFDNVSITGSGALLIPAPVQSSTITVRMDLVGHMATHVNPTSAAIAGSQLLLVDQAGWIYRWDGTSMHDLFAPAMFPSGIFPPGGESVLNVASDAAGTHVYVMFSTFTAPSGIPISVSPRPFDSWQVLYKYDFNGSALSNPSPIRAFQVRSDGHTGGGLVVLNDGTVLCAIGDNGDAGEDGRSYAQDASNHLAKILRVNPADGSATVVALGVRNVQRLAIDPNGGDPRLTFADLGGYVAEEIDSIRLANLLDGTPHNFGWGRSGVDNKAREGTFYIDANGSAVGAAPTPEAGFLQPVAQWGREGAPLIAASGPAISTVSFSTITALFGDLPTGAVWAVTGLPSVTGQPVYHVALVDNTLQPVTLIAIAGGNRPDPRFFTFPDGTAGVLLERTGDFYRLTQIAAAPASTR
jgi:subtilisin family serine protease/regulation of enolase protein 1 (concanavalin A-like superfamily)